MSKKHILIVDDDEMLLLNLEMMLDRLGYAVTTASDGQKGLELARELKPDLIVLDGLLPKMDGLKVCRLLKFDDHFKHIPVIILSARDQESDIKVGTIVGADLYLSKNQQGTKPVMEVLVEKIQSMVEAGTSSPPVGNGETA